MLMTGISGFHIVELFYYRDEFTYDFVGADLMNWLVTFYNALLPFSGLVIVATSFFLIGYQRERKPSKLRMAVIIVGVLVLGFTQNENPFDITSWEWDVYQYHFFTYLAVLALPLRGKLPWIYIGLCALILAFPPATFTMETGLPRFLQSMLFGHPGTADYSGWNLSPWLALPVMFFSLGAIIRRDNLYERGLLKLRNWEYPLLIALFVVSYLRVPSSEIPFGKSFPNYTFNQPPEVLWCGLLRFLVILRLYLDPRVNNWIANNRFTAYVSKMQWARRFGICYLASMAFMVAGLPSKNWFLAHPYVFEFFWLSIFFGTDFIVKGAFDYLERRRRYG